MGEAHLKVWQLLPEMQQNWLWDWASHRIGWWWWLERKEVRMKRTFIQIVPPLRWGSKSSLLVLLLVQRLAFLPIQWCNLSSEGGQPLVLTTGQSTVLGMPSKNVGFKIPQTEAVFPPKLCCCWHVGLKKISRPRGSLKGGWKLVALSWLPERVRVR